VYYTHENILHSFLLGQKDCENYWVLGIVKIELKLIGL